jgi:sporulation integral membrane protein YtvI
VVLTIMGTYYLSSDRERIFAFFHRTFPAEMVRKSVLLKRDIFKALFGQIRAQLLVSLMITVVVMLGLVLQQEPYWLLIGFLIGLADALPVLGAGLFLIPWSIVGFVMGNTTTGIGMALLYLAVVVVRQIAEPRIVGKNLGLYPLATMMAMFAGLQITGNVLGLLLGPVLLNLLKVVLRADSQAEAAPVSPRLKFTIKRRTKETAPDPNVTDTARREE